MNFKVFAAIFVGLLAINVSVQSPTLKDDSIKNIVVEILNQVVNETTKILNDVTTVVDNIEKDPEGVKDKIVEAAVAIGKQVNTEILGLIDRLKEKATDDGKHVVECIDAEQSQTEAALGQIFGDIGTCAVGETPKVIAEVRVILGQFTDLNNDIKGQTDTLSACSDSEITCLVAFVGTILETAKKIPAVVETDVQAIVELVGTIISDVEGCAKDVISSVGDDIQQIFNEAVVCIFQN